MEISRESNSKQKEKNEMVKAKEEMIREIEAAREKLNRSIDEKEAYGTIYRHSVELDLLLNQYILAGY